MVITQLQIQVELAVAVITIHQVATKAVKAVVV
jgi:hypothetical protein